MTAGVFVIQGNGIEIFSDGASYDAVGVMGELGSKVLPVPHCSAFVFASGQGNAVRLVKDKLAHCDDFDDMIRWIGTFTKGAALEARMIYGDHINLLTVIGGFSEREQEWQIWDSAVSQPIDGDPIVRDPKKRGNFFSNTMPPDDKLTEYGFGTVDNFIWNYSVDDGVRFLEAIRHTKQRLHADNLEEGCRCGGFIERTIIQRDKAYSEIIHRWPDRIGKKLNAMQEAA
jgi:hypothetical protein